MSMQHTSVMLCGIDSARSRSGLENVVSCNPTSGLDHVSTLDPGGYHSDGHHVDLSISLLRQCSVHSRHRGHLIEKQELLKKKTRIAIGAPPGSEMFRGPFVMILQHNLANVRLYTL